MKIAEQRPDMNIKVAAFTVSEKSSNKSMHNFNEKGNACLVKVSKGAKIRNRYNQVPHLTQDTNGKVTNSVRHHKREPRGHPFKLQ